MCTPVAIVVCGKDTQKRELDNESLTKALESEFDLPKCLIFNGDPDFQKIEDFISKLDKEYGSRKPVCKILATFDKEILGRIPEDLHFNYKFFLGIGGNHSGFDEQTSIMNLSATIREYVHYFRK
ncbi:MAG TPA: hypothetical protein PLA41_02875 [Candidatus Pacearchaeota archaeon]|nr:hypothetical protein [Candidatus Parcubacteria bacterium]HNZ84185.1 hypothetical protein [Candidatus Pacearchaeota archaeon]HOU46065.1 hypothetical protein [Candidatus Pacearchaeota archaeon]HPM08608.1 hypothetical protein [Candidatus Pacearchaeota archaeon]HQI74778.1 hypothetical protein [Candidatus Pacearchaeota archaeon]